MAPSTHPLVAKLVQRAGRRERDNTRKKKAEDEDNAPSMQNSINVPSALESPLEEMENRKETG